MDLSPHKNRLHLVPSQENLTKVTESTEATSNSSTPRQSKFHEEVPDLPISPLARNKVSFYSCRATASPSPPEAEDESVYTQDESVRTQVLKPTWSEENVTGTGTRRSFSFETDPIFSPLNFSKRKDAPSSSTHPAHRRAVSDETGGKSSERAKSYERLVANETERQRRVADEAEEDELIEVTRRAEEEENEKVMREQQQKKVSDTSTATAVSTSGTAPDIVGKDAEKGNSIEKAVTVLDPHPNGTSTSQEVAYKTLRTYFMGIIISMGGLVFGYGGIGQIGGFLVMHDYANRFGNKTDIDGNKTFSDVRQGTVVGLLMIGALIGALVAAPVTDRFGRKHCISFWAMIFAVGQVIEISTQRVWWQLVIGRVVEGLGIGGLSILTPLYMGEVAPKQIRGVMIRYV
jgi:hypothetical protein